MRKSWALVSLVLFSWIGGLGPDARAGVTIDMIFQDMVIPTGITVSTWVPSEAVGPGCTFTGYYHRTVSTGRCADVILMTSDALTTVSGSVRYDTDNGLAVASYYEWKGVGVSFGKAVEPRKCGPLDGISDSGTQIDWFDCGITPPNNPPVMPAGSYRLGTIVWNTSGVFWGAMDNQEVISVVGASANAIINGNVVDITGQVVAGKHIIRVIPEPATAALLGLGFVGLIVVARRRRG